MTERKTLEKLSDSELSGRIATSDMARNYSAILMSAGLGFLTVAPEFIEDKGQIVTTIYGVFFLLSGYVFGEASIADARASINEAKNRGFEILKKPFFRHIKLNGGN